MGMEELKQQIEAVREELEIQLLKSNNMLDCMDINLKLDALIEEYLDLTLKN